MNAATNSSDAKKQFDLPPWAILPIAAMMALALAALLFFGVQAISTKPSPEERAIYEARCHAAANWAGHSAYAILKKAKPDSCQIMLPEGGIPVGLSWTGYP